MSARPITFLSDYGYRDPFAGTCRAVISRIAPDAPLVDLTHGIARQDVAAGAHALAVALPFAAPGVHLAVVDPGVGSSRRAVAIRTAAEDRYLVGPDNGLLSLAVELFGGADVAVEITESPVRLEPVSATFHGRDLFAPVAAHLALGARLDGLGVRIEVETLERVERSAAKTSAGRIVTQIAYVDGYGNATLTATGADAQEAGLGLGAELLVEVASTAHPARSAATFADVAVGDLLVYTNSSGSLTLGANQRSAAELLGLVAGTEIVLTKA